VAGGNPFNVAATPSITYTYDSGFHGVLSSVTSGSNTTSYSFDSLGRISGSTQTTPGYSPFTFGYGYSLTDQRTSITYPSGRLVQLTLDAADRVTAVQKPGGAGNYATINYTAPSGISSLTMGNGVSENVSWNDRLQPVGLTAAAGSTNLLTLGLYPCPGAVTACASANNGDVQSQAISFPALNGASPLSVTQAYTYDSVNRLTQATETGTSNWTQQYGYDTAGNRWVSNNTRAPRSQRGNAANLELVQRFSGSEPDLQRRRQSAVGLRCERQHAAGRRNQSQLHL
jgi:uncharacterized protein RhaS with RHS repeats